MPTTPATLSPAQLARMANAVRFLSVDMVNAANSGHPGAPMGMAEFLTVLFARFLVFNPAAPQWAGRDRFVLSNGHASAALYALLHLTGYDLAKDDLRAFRQLGSRTPGHPEFGHTAGVEVTSGPLGQGLATAVGLALGQKMAAARLAGTSVADRLGAARTFVTVGDGCLMEGLSHEAAELAAHWGLDNLVVLFDDNGISIDGRTSLATSTDIRARFESYGWRVLDCFDGHDVSAVEAVLGDALAVDAKGAKVGGKPTLIMLKTTIGHGAGEKAGTHGVHGSPLGADARAQAAAAMGWEAAPFEVPADVQGLWRAVSDQHVPIFEAWDAALTASVDGLTAEQRTFLAAIERQERWGGTDADAALQKNMMDDLKRQAEMWRQKVQAENGGAVSTRTAGGVCLEAVYQIWGGRLVSGSADLTSSVFTQPKGMAPVQAGRYDGSYVHYGVREHAMGSVMNGLLLHGGFAAVGGTFMAFSDYMKPAIRLAALMRRPALYLLTHDSIALGEDGPTHQPVEHLAALRVLPNVAVFRPADALETAACMALALEHEEGPSVLSLSRQDLPVLAEISVGEVFEGCARGGYILKDVSDGLPLQAVLLATGSEVSLALAAQTALAAEGVGVRVVSMPCVERFLAQDEVYRQRLLLLGQVPVLAIEAASSFGWERVLKGHGAFMGVDGFGASGKPADLMGLFRLTAGDVAVEVKKQLSYA